MENCRAALDLIENRWPHLRIVVVGDVMLDTYLWGHVERISPEAPVPIVRASRKTVHAGGAANVAANLAGLGAASTIIGCIGDDLEGKILCQVVDDLGLDRRFRIIDSIPTTHKSRVLGGHQQLLRIDVENASAFPPDVYDDLKRSISEAVNTADAVVLSDYAKGVLTPEICRHVIDAARKKGIPVLVDPKARDFQRYRGATTVCPNLHELAVALNCPVEPAADLFDAAKSKVTEWGLDFLTVTMSEKGITLMRPDSVELMPAVARQVFDVSGAGDTVIATLAAGLAAGLSPRQAIEVANIAAGIVVGKVGTVPIQHHEIVNELSHHFHTDLSEKVLERSELAARIESWRVNRDSVVFTNGCFDLLHVGHITLLEQAKKMGNRLVVAINSDRSVSRLKGDSRPLVGECERARLLAALSCVDAVTIFDESTPLDLIKLLRPNVLVKGGDYTAESVVGAAEMRSWNGRVAIVPTVDGFSTTDLIARMTAGAK